VADRPAIFPEQRVKVGTVTAVVCEIYNERMPVDDVDDKTHADAYVVFLDEGEAIGIHIKWTGSGWEFTPEGDYGIHADRRSDLRPFVDILRGKRTNI
jgi:hypothetical protein